MQSGRFSSPLHSPKNSVGDKFDTRGTGSAPSKRWFAMVEEEENVGARSAPAWAEHVRQDAQIAQVSPQTKMVSAEGIKADYLSQQAAAAEFPPLSLPRQELAVDGADSPHTPVSTPKGTGYPVAAGHINVGDADSGNSSLKSDFKKMHNSNGLTGTGAFLGGRYSMKDVIAYGGISEESQLGIRSSSRIRAQPNADATQMDRAQQQASVRDPAFYSGTKHLNKFTLASFSNSEVINRAATLGVSLGRTNSQIIQSIDLLKETDLDRTLFTLKRKEEKANEPLDDSSSLVLEEANNLSKDLLVEEMFENENHKDISVKPQKATRAYKKKVKEVKIPCRRSKRLKDKI
jgi:hypothetical protein